MEMPNSETVFKGQDHIDPRMSEEFQGFVKVILSPLQPYKPPDFLCRMSVQTEICLTAINFPAH